MQGRDSDSSNEAAEGKKRRKKKKPVRSEEPSQQKARTDEPTEDSTVPPTSESDGESKSETMQYTSEDVIVEQDPKRLESSLSRTPKSIVDAMLDEEVLLSRPEVRS